MNPATEPEPEFDLTKSKGYKLLMKIWPGLFIIIIIWALVWAVLEGSKFEGARQACNSVNMNLGLDTILDEYVCFESNETLLSGFLYVDCYNEYSQNKCKNPFQELNQNNTNQS